MSSRAHWNERYRTAGPESVSWHEPTPTVSLDLFNRLEVSAAQSVINVGGGASTLVGHLLERGHTEVAVLDGLGLRWTTPELAAHEGLASVALDSGMHLSTAATSR